MITRSVEYTQTNLRKEADFLNELENSEKAKKHLQTNHKLREEVYIPEVYREVSIIILSFIIEWIYVVSVSVSNSLDLYLNIFPYLSI